MSILIFAAGVFVAICDVFLLLFLAVGFISVVVELIGGWKRNKRRK